MIPDWLQNNLEYKQWQKQLIEGLDEILADESSVDTWNKNFPKEKLSNWLNNIDSESYYSSWIYSFLTNADEELIELWLNNGLLQDDPIWLNELVQKQTNDVARVFLLTGNVNDYAYSPQNGYMPILDLIRENVKRQGQVVFRYSLSNHFGSLSDLEENSNNNPTQRLRTYLGSTDRQPNQPSMGIWDRVQQDFKFINDLLKERFNEGVCIVVEHADMLFPHDARELERNVLVEFLLNWAVAPWMFQSNNQIILLAETVNDISNNLKSQTNKIEIIDIKRPETKEERLKFLISINASEAQEVENQDNLRIKTGFSFPRVPYANTTNSNFQGELSKGLDNVAEKSSGLNYLGLEDLLLQTRNNDGELSIETITNIKGKILQDESAGLIELVETKKTFSDVGGFGKIKSRLSNISEAMLNKGASKLITRTIPMGILFLGPPGTGKTLIAQAFANMCNTNFVKLGDFRSMWVGQSERNLSKALELIRSLSPVIVFMDEIDQSEGSRGESGDSGVGKRIFSKLLQFMSDTTLRGKVLWIAASNRPDLIDAALKRAGRFDMTIPFFLPNLEAREEIFKIHLKNDAIDISSIANEQWINLAQQTRGFTGAEIEVVANESIRRVIHGENIQNNMPLEIKANNLEEVLDSYTPTLNRGTYYKMMALALQDINFIDVLPEEYQEARQKLLEQPNVINGNIADLMKLFNNIQ